MDVRLTVACLLLGLLIAGAFYPLFRRREWEGRLWACWLSGFIILMGVGIVVWRWRSLTYNGEINVDESQVLSQAMRYMLDPLPWRSVDGGSSGPLNTWALLWAPLVGLKLDYLAARLTGVFCVWATFGALALAMVELVGRRWALALLMPAMCFVFTTTNLDFAFFSSEQLPSAISACVVYLIFRQWRTHRFWAGYLIGFLTGALPFCKIQTGPAALLLFGAAAWSAIARLGRTKTALKALVWMALGGITVPCLILVPVAAGGAWGDFMELYIRTALGYKNKGSGGRAGMAGALIFGVKEFGFLATSTLVLSAGALALSWVKSRSLRWKTGHGLCLAGAVLYLAVTTYCVLRSGYPFPHYLTLLIVPGVVLLGMSFCPLLSLSQPKPGNVSIKAPLPSSLLSRRPVAAVWALCLAVLLQTGVAVDEIYRNKQFIANWGNGALPIGEWIRGQVKPGDTLAVWGWAPKFNVMSQVPPATRFSQCIFLLDPAAPESMRQVFLSRFIADLGKSKPRLFLDAPDEFIWPEYPHGVAARHFGVKAVSDFVREHYSLVGNIPSPPGKVPIMVYRLKEGS